MLVVFDASTVVGAALKRDGIPRRSLLIARARHSIALSDEVFREIREVLSRPKFAAVITDEVRAELLEMLTATAIWVGVDGTVADCRDPKDNIYLALAEQAHADVIVSSDQDLLVLHPWRGVQLLRPRAFLDFAETG